MFPLRDANPKHGPVYLMWLLVVANVAVFVYQLGLSEPQLRSLVLSYGFVPRAFFGDPLGEGYRLLSSMFLHGNLLHLASNMFFLWVFGDNIEDRMGHGKFLLFYLAGGVVAAASHGLLMPNSAIPMIGASGGVSAVLGAYIVAFPRQRILTFIPPLFLLWLPAWFYLGYWALIQVIGVLGGGAGGIAWWAHIGGFVFGVVLAPWLLHSGSRK
ncbi:MAG: rhomboid family intramembrane serine protease [Truepera sp.]|nr:rhomboid family intramembrane serine protease [Truepera sp.]